MQQKKSFIEYEKRHIKCPKCDMFPIFIHRNKISVHFQVNANNIIQLGRFCSGSNTTIDELVDEKFEEEFAISLQEHKKLVICCNNCRWLSSKYVIINNKRFCFCPNGKYEDKIIKKFINFSCSSWEEDVLRN